LVLIKSDVKKEVNEISLNKRFTNNNQYKEKANSNISLPNFVEKKVKNLRRSINSDKLKEKIVNNGFPAFVESFGDKGNLHAIYVGPFLSEDDIVTNMDLIKSISESNNGEISRWKL